MKKMDKIKNVRMWKSRPGFRKVAIGFYFIGIVLKSKARFSQFHILNF